MQARPEAVAIIDVVNPRCGLPDADEDDDLRGVGSPSIQNNLIRTLFSQASPGGMQPTQWAMLGIDSTDTAVATGTSLGDTNAFRATRVGGSNNAFFSQIPPGGTAPTPKVNIGNKLRDLNDPYFVGELLSNCGATCGVPADYRDWRLMFESRLAGKGSSPDESGQLIALNGTAYYEPLDVCYELRSFPGTEKATAIRA